MAGTLEEETLVHKHLEVYSGSLPWRHGKARRSFTGVGQGKNPLIEKAPLAV